MKKKSTINSWSGILLFCLCTLTACFEGEEGCLDVDAVSFDVSVDEACGDCCTYPTLSLTFNHKVYQEADTLNFSYQTAYLNDLKQYFALDQIQYYVSDLQFIEERGASVTVIDRIDLATLESNDTIYFEVADNFVITNPDDFRSQSVGTMIYNGNVSALQFSLGLPEAVQATEPDFLPDGHPLAVQEPTMYIDSEERYLYNQIDFFRDTTDFNTTPEVIQITDFNDLITVTLPVSGEIPSGFNIGVTIEVDYLQWFSGVDFTNDSNASIKNKIVANLADSFRILAINLSR